MKSYAGQGWISVKDQLYVSILLFLYRLLWGYCLYRLVKSAVVPLLVRYPDSAPNELSRLLFFFEGEMSLTLDDTVHTFGWLLAGLLLIRMVLTPLIRAGIFYNLHQESSGQRGLFFFTGMQKLWKSVTVFYIIELVLTFIPGYWLIPKLLPILLSSIQAPTVLLHALPYVAAWLLYAYLIRMILMYMQFGRTGNTSLLTSALALFRRLGTAVLISITVGGSTMVIMLLLGSASLYWAGFIGLIVQQASYFLSGLFQIWIISSQYHLWKASVSEHR
ncbi:hypothetical protein JCM10914A_20590 [Paenibacillus sp. JCM 10914]|uniref:hypothetical protein n=1 Tax=Paenibacillus sp. JCM 10914 TaxID=1236974 RepID=UPI0003CC9410|nr:hypothetical protein [Paenibacillus sp. JCM 10914]GAE09277.1 hypothetical protein JCM10914_5632 [Paenibacillus sp. JCM 10914]